MRAACFAVGRNRPGYAMRAAGGWRQTIRGKVSKAWLTCSFPMPATDKERVAPLVAAIEAQGLDGLVGPGDRGRPAVRRPDRGRAECRQVRARRLDPDVRSVPLGPRRGARGRRSRHPGAGAIRRGPPADGRARPAHHRPRPLGRRPSKPAIPGSAARTRLDDRAQQPRHEPENPPARLAPPAAAKSTRVSICVLPFANMSGDAEQEYFSDGISEDIITDLSKVSSLAVVSRNTAFSFKGTKRRHCPDREAAQGQLRAGRQRAQGRRPRADHRPADRRCRRTTTSGPSATTAT